MRPPRGGCHPPSSIPDPRRIPRRIEGAGSDFNDDFEVSTPKGEIFGLSVFLRDGDNVFRTYFTNGRGVEALGSVWTLLDLTPYGRQETWEDSPEGWPQTAPYEWWRRHDEYGDQA